jgi:endonuclease/exonuclease/phosphatase family metal-dependent hydrolase
MNLKAILIAATLLITAVVVDSVAQRRSSITLRILTYNIYHGETTGGRVDMDLFASIINEVKPDLVALQEVDKNAERTGVIDITEELSKRTGLKGYFVKHRDFQGGEYGNAILSRFPVTDVDVIEGYKSTPNGITIPFVKTTVAKGTEIIFNCTHLSTRPEDRKAQAQQLMDYYAAGKGTPMIITGDLNAEPHHEEIKMLLEPFAEADTTFENTFSTRTGLKKKIDFILYPRNDQWEVLETKVICRRDASDHCAFFVVLRFDADKRSRRK